LITRDHLSAEKNDTTHCALITFRVSDRPRGNNERHTV
jgi:hypothetical protein